MKKIIIILIFCLFMTSCSSEFSQEYVKNICFSKTETGYKISVNIYDFSTEKEEYRTEIFTDIDLHKMAIRAVKNNGYNFRLCEHILLTPEIINSDFDKVFSVINYLKIPPAADILCITADSYDADISFSMSGISPIYNFSHDSEGASGIVRIMDVNSADLGAVIIDHGDPVKVLNDRQFKILNLLTGNKKGFITSTKDGDMLFETYKNDVYFSIRQGTLNIKITINLKDYKGNTNEDLAKQLIKNDISDMVYELYSDITIRQSAKLDWYSKMNNQDIKWIDVEIDIL